MKGFCVLMASFVVQSVANVDIFNKCPDFRPHHVSDMKKLDGKWFTREMMTHYEGKHALLDPGLCITFNLNSYKNYTSPDSRVSAVNITLKTYDIVEEERNVTQIINFTMRIDAAKPGFWTENDIRNFQVIMIDDNFTVITLCGKTRLISFALSRQEGANVTSALEIARETLERRGLSFEKTETLCESKATILAFNLLLLVASVSTRFILKNSNSS